MKKIITIIGLGNVGQIIAQNLLMIKEQMFTINIMDPKDVSGSIYDLEHAAAVYKYHTIFYNNLELFDQSDFIFHTAGPSFHWEAGRLSVTDQSVALTYDIFKNYQAKKEPYIIVISNPVDVISYHTYKATGLPAKRIFGTGTYLDTVRFESKLAKAYDLNPTFVKGLILGEHGNSQVQISQETTLGNVHSNSEEEKAKVQAVAADTIEAAHQIIKTQGATKYGVSMCAIRLMLSILNDDPITVPISVLLNAYNQELLQVPSIYLSVLCRVDGEGVQQLNLSELQDKELDLLRASAKTIEQFTGQSVHQV